MSLKYFAQKVGPNHYVLPRTGGMRTEAHAFFSEALFDATEESMWASPTSKAPTSALAVQDANPRGPRTPAGPDLLFWASNHMAKKPRPRGQRRETERAQSKLAQARQRLFGLEVGGSAERPLPVVSAAVIEAHAESVPCPSCESKHEIVEHVAVTRLGVRLREVRLRCRQCGTGRSLWFRINDVGPN